jgi:hypothetical protein
MSEDRLSRHQVTSFGTRITAWQVNSTDTDGIEHAERWTNDEDTAWEVARKVLAGDDVVKVTVEKDMR